MRTIIDQKWDVIRPVSYSGTEPSPYDLLTITGALVIEGIATVNEETDTIYKMYYMTEYGMKVAKT